MIKIMYWVESNDGLMIAGKIVPYYEVVPHITLFNRYVLTKSIIGPFSREEDANKLCAFYNSSVE